MLQAAGSSLDLLNVMSYDASDAYSVSEGYSAYRYYYPGAILMGVEVPLEVGAPPTTPARLQAPPPASSPPCKPGRRRARARARRPACFAGQRPGHCRLAPLACAPLAEQAWGGHVTDLTQVGALPAPPAPSPGCWREPARRRAPPGAAQRCGGAAAPVDSGPRGAGQRHR
jgi:hypothetical protein